MERICATKEEFIPIMEKIITRFNIYTSGIIVGKEFLKLKTQETFSKIYYNLSKEMSPKAIAYKDFEEEYIKKLIKIFRVNSKLDNKKVFYSLPITGQVDKAREKCERVKDYFEKYIHSCKLYTPFEVAPKDNMPISYYISKNLEQLLECDFVLQDKDWEISKGCRVENFVCSTYFISTIKEEDVYFSF